MLKRIRAASLPFVLALTLLGIPQIIVAQNVQELLQQGIEAGTAGKHTEAERIFRQAIQLEPNNADAYRKLGNALYYQGKLEEAIAAYEKAIELNPDYAYAYYNLGIALGDRGKLEEAIAAFRTAIELNPDEAANYNNLGGTLLLQGKPDEAIAAYEKAISLKPDYTEAYNNLGGALLLQGKPDEAIAALRKAIELNPDFAGAYNNLGGALLLQEKPDEAIAAFRKAIELKPDDALIYNNLGGALLLQEKPDEAIAAFRKAIELNPNEARTYTNLGGALYKQGKLDEAIAALRNSSQLTRSKGTLTSAHALAHNGWGWLLQEQGKLEEAIAEYKRAIAIDPKFATAQNNLKEAERLLAIKLNPPLANIDDRQYLPSEKDEPLVPVLRSTVRIIVAGSTEQNPYPGAGWVIKREEDTVWIVTNRHVISDNRTKKPLTEIKVEFYSEPPKDVLRPRYTATLVQMTDLEDRTLDLAILKVTGIPDDIKTLKLRPGRVRRLASVIVIGHPYNRDNPWDAVRGTVTSQGEILPIDANVATGNSGGPIVDEQTHEVIGILFGIRDASDPARPDEIASLKEMRGTEGVGVAYPIDRVISKLQEWQILPK